MAFARLRFMVFVLIVLGLPAALMSTADTELVELGKLVMILSPAVAGLALSSHRWNRAPGPNWRWVLYAGAVTLAVAAGSLVVALAVGAVNFRLQDVSPAALLGPIGGSVLTSVLEELGWAGGGLTLAIAALGGGWGVLVLGLVWAAWHLIPVMFRVGLFPYLEVAPPLMFVAFVVACVVYRELLTQLRDRAGSWLGAAAGHAAPNILLAGLLAAGVELYPGPADWLYFPAPGGLVFPTLVLVALLMLRRGAREGLR